MYICIFASSFPVLGHFMFVRGVLHLVVIGYILLFTFVMLIISFTNVSNIFIVGKQDYKKSKKEVKSQKQRAEKKNSAIGIKVKKKNYYPCIVPI